MSATTTFRIEVKTTNPNNGATGNTRVAAIIRARKRAAQRRLAWAKTLSVVGLSPRFPLVVTVCRLAPSGGLDPHDGLGAALKGCIDGIADGLGLKNDRDARVTWLLGQRRAGKGVYAVEVSIRLRLPCEVTASDPGATSSD